MDNFRIYLTVLIAGFLALFALAVVANAAPVCMPADQFRDVVQKNGYVMVWTGLDGSGISYVIISDAKSELWAAVAITADNSKACFVAEGIKNKLLSTGA